MRPITRSSTRLTKYRRDRPSSLPHSQKCQPDRTFRTASVQRAQEPSPPSGSSNPSNPHNESREKNEKAGVTSPWREQSSEQDNAESQVNGDASRHGMRRTLRHKRINDVPKPPPIPDWFLKENVRLEKHSPRFDVEDDGKDVLRCVDAQTGHTLFTLPFFNKGPRERELVHPVYAMRRQTAEKLFVTEEADAKRKDSPENKQQSTPINPSTENLQTLEGNGGKDGKSFLATWFNSMPLSQRDVSKSIPMLQFLHVLHAIDPTAPRSSESDRPRVHWSSVPFERRNPRHTLAWYFIEAETTLRAAFSLANANQRTSSYALDRVDLSLHCLDPNAHIHMDAFVCEIASVLNADIIRFDANDFADLTEDYVGQGLDEPGSFGTLGYDVYDGLEAGGARANAPRVVSEAEEDEDAEDNELEDASARDLGPLAQFPALGDFLRGHQSGIGNAIRTHVIGIGINGPRSSHSSRRRSASQQPDMNRDDARLTALLDNLLDAPTKIQGPGERAKMTEAVVTHFEEKDVLRLGNSMNRLSGYQLCLRQERNHPALWLPRAADLVASYVHHSLGVEENRAKLNVHFERGKGIASSAPARATSEEGRRTIVHIRDLQDILNSRLGDAIIQRLVKVVRRRRRNGQQIVIVGTSTQDVAGPFRMPGDHADDFPFRTLNIPPFFNDSPSKDGSRRRDLQTQFPRPPEGFKPGEKVLEVNLRLLQRMLRRMKPGDDIDLCSEAAAPRIAALFEFDVYSLYQFTNKVFSFDEVQRIALMAVGLAESHAKSEGLHPIHVFLAAHFTRQTTGAEKAWSASKTATQPKDSSERSNEQRRDDSSQRQKTTAERIEQLKKICNQHETRLLNGMVDPQNITTGFADVHAPTETIEALKSLTTLSLLRPDAFKYGVLAKDRLPGLLLYGPPGTGKTLLAKAVAKESKATVLEVSGASIYDKWVGEGEKNVRAVFSLAKKLSPCVVFIDEADAIFGSRSQAGNRSTHRETINQFLREWDGLTEHSVFMMVASNRPFDLDDAVLRRLPRRLLVDLPTAKDRESILGIHLKNEARDESVSLHKLAEQTPLYSGSDLKNLAVAAALACVREENDLTEANKDVKEFKLPEKRTLSQQHFDKALAEISASISEDMGSLKAIRKFDERFGDRKGRRKKASYGFGASDGAEDEDAARVRKSTSSPPPP